MEHKSVFKKDAVNHLNVKSGGIYVDVTLGAGGHSMEILGNASRINLICFDLDNQNILEFRKQLEKKGIDYSVLKEGEQFEKSEATRVYLINDNFSNLNKYLGGTKVDGILADLGWSSDQLQNIPGLSFQEPFEELDMRLSNEFGVKAKDLLNALSKKELVKMFENYGDVKGFQNQRLVSAVISFRKNNLFETVKDLVEVIDQSLGNNRKNFGSSNHSDYAKVFQSLRIAVNNEMNNLKELLVNSWDVVEKGGVMVIITFHSGEERLVKSFFKNFIDSKLARFNSSQYGEVYLRPTVEELTENLRSRSAKLWAIEKL